MSHFVIGTAGHIDHGKTSIVKALTSIDCDTHPEEKKRGITINLGFAYSQIEEDKYLAFVDVPGHHRFIRNMISGASGIDYLMLIIAADDGIMPQTKEHFKICSMLGIQRGVIVLNKIDLVDEERIDQVKMDIKHLIQGSFLDEVEILEVSALSGLGVDNLKNHLLQQINQKEKKYSASNFRMYLDRFFNVDGFGTVVTGTVAEGSVSTEDSLIHLPSEKKIRVRQIQRHDKEVDTAVKGTRAAINIAGGKKLNLQMGDMFVKHPLVKSQKLDAKIFLLDDIKKIKKSFEALLFSGTYKTTVKIKLLDKISLEPGQSALVQIELAQAWYFFYGENFILRNTSSDQTIGGGKIIDPTPLHHKKKPDSLIQDLTKVSENETEYIKFKLLNSNKIINPEFIRRCLQWDEQNFLSFLDKSSEFVVLSSDEQTDYLIAKETKDSLAQSLIGQLKQHQQKESIDSQGVNMDKLMTIIKTDLPYKDDLQNKLLIELLSKDLVRNKKLFRNNNLWSAIDYDEQETQHDKDLIDIEKAILSEGVSCVGEKRIYELAEDLNIPIRKTKEVIRKMTELKMIKRFEKHFAHSKHIDQGRNKIIEYFNSTDDGLTVANFRDLIGGNRRIALNLFDLFEKEGIVYRDGDYRYKT